MNTIETKLAQLCASYGLTLTASPAHLTTDAEGWEHFAFTCSLLRHGKQIWSGPYKVGTGHLKVTPWRVKVMHTADAVMWQQMARPGAKILAQHKQAWDTLRQRLASETKLEPSLEDVIHSLVLDTQGLDQPFEDWARDFGFDSDSRKAEAVFHACRATHDQLRRHLSSAELAELAEAASEY